MPSVVFDSSVLIPLILETSRSTGLFLRLEAAGWHVVVSPQILRETREKNENQAVGAAMAETLGRGH
jgi:hypothetical protein